MSVQEHKSGVFELTTLVSKKILDASYLDVKEDTKRYFVLRFADTLASILYDERSYIVKLDELKFIPLDANLIQARQTMTVYLSNSLETEIGDYLESDYFDYWLEQHDSDHLTDVSESGKVFRRTNYGWIRVA